MNFETGFLLTRRPKRNFSEPFYSRRECTADYCNNKQQHRNNQTHTILDQSCSDHLLSTFLIFPDTHCYYKSCSRKCTDNHAEERQPPNNITTNSSPACNMPDHEQSVHFQDGLRGKDVKGKPLRLRILKPDDPFHGSMKPCGHILASAG